MKFHNIRVAKRRVNVIIIYVYLQVDSTWIIYNKPKSNDLTNEYAGFLMALGLNGHLVSLHTLNVHDYLSKVSLMSGFLMALG